MEQPWENFDNVILASPMLKSRRINDNGTTIELRLTKLLQKSEMRKDIVIELSYKGFS